MRGRIGLCLVRFAVAPPPPKGARSAPFAAQLAVARVHACLVPMTATNNGFQMADAASGSWSELSPGRGLAGYGLSRALRMLLDALAGLSALHATRTDDGPFVHGELVPALLRVDESGTTRLVPLAPWHSSAPGMPAAEQRWAHLAPERLLGDLLDQRADVFSAGALLWEALAGRRLFAGCSVEEIITRLMGGKVSLPALPRELDWAHGLELVARRALSADPAQRFASAEELARAIELIAAGKIASHRDVAAFFAQRDPHARPSPFESALEPPTHNSSLSALVSPLQPSQVAPLATAPLAAPRASKPPGRRSSKSWSVALVSLSLLTVLGLAWAARSNGRREEPHVSASVPQPAVSAASAPLAPSPPVPSATLERVDSDPSAIRPVPPPSTGRKGVKAKGSVQAPKPSSQKLRAAPLKSAPPSDKEAEIYGI